MSLFRLFRSGPKNSAETAKERLKVIIARERAHRDGPDYLPKMRQEIIDVIRKYVNVSDEHVKMQFENYGDMEKLELDITLGEVPE
ncbi:MAG: cell division topological specificity factor MinE [Gammaproteobacteria bacterium]